MVLSREDDLIVASRKYVEDKLPVGPVDGCGEIVWAVSVAWTVVVKLLIVAIRQAKYSFKRKLVE